MNHIASMERDLTCQSSRETHTDTLQIGAETLRLVEVQYSGIGCCAILTYHAGRDAVVIGLKKNPSAKLIDTQNSPGLARYGRSRKSFVNGSTSSI